MGSSGSSTYFKVHFDSDGYIYFTYVKKEGDTYTEYPTIFLEVQSGSTKLNTPIKLWNYNTISPNSDNIKFICEKLDNGSFIIMMKNSCNRVINAHNGASLNSKVNPYSYSASDNTTFRFVFAN